MQFFRNEIIELKKSFQVLKKGSLNSCSIIFWITYRLSTYVDGLTARSRCRADPLASSCVPRS